jgi:hypothetical protein
MSCAKRMRACSVFSNKRPCPPSIHRVIEMSLDCRPHFLDRIRGRLNQGKCSPAFRKMTACPAIGIVIDSGVSMAVPLGGARRNHGLCRNSWGSRSLCATTTWQPAIYFRLAWLFSGSLLGGNRLGRLKQVPQSCGADKRQRHVVSADWDHTDASHSDWNAVVIAVSYGPSGRARGANVHRARSTGAAGRHNRGARIQCPATHTCFLPSSPSIRRPHIAGRCGTLSCAEAEERC